MEMVWVSVYIFQGPLVVGKMRWGDERLEIFGHLNSAFFMKLVTACVCACACAVDFYIMHFLWNW